MGQVWNDYASLSTQGKKPRPLTKRQTKRFLEDFLQISNLSEEGFDKVFRMIDSSETGEVGQEQMANWILVLSGFEDLANSNTIRRRIKRNENAIGL